MMDWLSDAGKCLFDSNYIHIGWLFVLPWGAQNPSDIVVYLSTAVLCVCSLSLAAVTSSTWTCFKDFF